MIRPRHTRLLLLALSGLVLANGGRLRADPKPGAYPFPLPPLAVYEQLGKADLGKVEPFAPGDAKLLAEVWAARTKKPPAALAPADDTAVRLHLLASGVSEGKRDEYLKKFTALVGAARDATAGARSDREKADQLLRFLHKATLTKGYVADETTLDAVFDKKAYNCVSSSCLYYLVGTRLGLKLQPVLIPGSGWSAGHAAVDLIDGTTRIEIEPTNPDGYDWPAKLKRSGVIVLGFQPDRKKAYDSDGFGLAGSIASNLAAAALAPKPPRAREAVRWLAISLTLAPNDPSPKNNLLATFGKWGNDHADAGRYEEALKVFACARTALDDRELERNHNAIWARYLDTVFGAGKFEDGLKLVPRAAAAFPKEKSFSSPAEWVTRAARRKNDKDGPAAGLTFADAALEYLSGDAAKSVRDWKVTARRMWSQQLLAKKDAAGSLRVLADGLAESPDDKQFFDALGYHTQEALTQLAAKDRATAVAYFKELREKFPKVSAIQDAGLSHANRALDDLCKANKFEDAMKTATALAPLAGKEGALKGRALDHWARSLATAGKWPEALAKYTEALAACPDDVRLRNNGAVMVDQWARKSMDKKDWKEAVRIYELGLKPFPDSRVLKNNREYCLAQLKEK
ncbi:transglutaminase family protein [Frigoriglobus tundricola]|uniref:Protein SirB1 N-terminal domain-containing protein n=1 Tax=Frigoriglobus tundricola TaxID=2774151 RepID=A0A6M5YQZ2_9BACT|nr:transglutaminase family protein [Frigoriglobus tundricola]QJW95840.1 hypothetical protein FTUN_3394 [Frigoriglobus tundricola]